MAAVGRSWSWFTVRWTTPAVGIGLLLRYSMIIAFAHSTYAGTATVSGHRVRSIL